MDIVYHLQRRIFLVYACLSVPVLSAQEGREYHVLSIAFYNVENLYDIYNDPLTFDDDRTPTGKDKWTRKIYKDKINKLARVISQIAVEQAGSPPAVVGLCEVENRAVLEDLVSHPLLVPFEYDIVHYDSPDQRGIDVALIYQRKLFQPSNSVVHELILYDPKDARKRLYTRDQLVVSGLLAGEEIHLIVNHWPSRSGGEKASAYKRDLAAKLNKRILDSIHRIDPYAKLMSIGDFNDDPSDSSLKKTLGAKQDKEAVGFQELFNPMASLSRKGIGSLAYRDGWNLFDQILLTRPFLQKDNGFNFYKAAVFNPQFLITPRGQYRGYPFRSFGSGGYTGGYSDHFPVYVLLIKKKG